MINFTVNIPIYTSIIYAITRIKQVSPDNVTDITKPLMVVCLLIHIVIGDNLYIIINYINDIT